MEGISIEKLTNLATSKRKKLPADVKKPKLFITLKLYANGDNYSRLSTLVTTIWIKYSKTPKQRKEKLELFSALQQSTFYPDPKVTLEDSNEKCK